MAFASHMTECWKYLLSLGNLFLVNLGKMPCSIIDTSSTKQRGTESTTESIKMTREFILFSEYFSADNFTCFSKIHGIIIVTEGEVNQIVFAELVTHVVETQRGGIGGVVFKLAHLCNLYESRLNQFETNSTFNRTRLKNGPTSF
jgi:hypothetical protein